MSKIIANQKFEKSNNNRINLNRTSQSYQLLLSKIELKLSQTIILAVVFSCSILIYFKYPENVLNILTPAIVIFHLVPFLVMPWFFSLVQQSKSRIEWISLTEFDDFSPEVAQALRQICIRKKIKTLRLGIVNEQKPSASIYSSIPDRVHLVLSKGLFNILKEEQVDLAALRQISHTNS